MDNSHTISRFDESLTYIMGESLTYIMGESLTYIMGESLTHMYVYIYTRIYTYIYIYSLMSNEATASASSHRGFFF